MSVREGKANCSLPNLLKQNYSQSIKEHTNKSMSQVAVPFGNGLIKLIKCLPEESIIGCYQNACSRATSQIKAHKMLECSNREWKFQPNAKQFYAPFKNKMMVKKQERAIKSVKKELKEVSFRPKINLPANPGLGEISFAMACTQKPKDSDKNLNKIHPFSDVNKSINLYLQHHNNIMKKSYDFVAKQSKLKYAEQTQMPYAKFKKRSHTGIKSRQANNYLYTSMDKNAVPFGQVSPFMFQMTHKK
jgi:hypothetical protein